MTTHKQSDDAAAQAAVEGRKPEPRDPQPRALEQVPAGPHAEPALTNPAATPGTGALPPVDPDEQGNMDSTSS
jgi:hypothetical protein